MLREFLGSDFSGVSDHVKLKGNIEIYNTLLSIERSYTEELREKYYTITGLHLPC
jgi:hypothetical protein